MTAFSSILLECHTWPGIEYMSAMLQAADVCLDSYKHYQKRSCVNRYQICGPNGIQWLTIPLRKGKHTKCPVKDLKISYDEDWRRLHWKAIENCYRSAPFYLHLEDPIQTHYRHRPTYLLDWIERQNNWLYTYLAMDTTLRHTTEYFHEAKNYEDLRDQWYKNYEATTYLQPYPQVFLYKYGFVPNVSILDLLFNLGPSAIDYLRNTEIHTGEN